MVKSVLVAQCKQWAETGGYPEGSLMMDAPAHGSIEELMAMAEDRSSWRLVVKSFSLSEGLDNSDEDN